MLKFMFNYGCFVLSILFVLYYVSTSLFAKIRNYIRNVSISYNTDNTQDVTTSTVDGSYSTHLARHR